MATRGSACACCGSALPRAARFCPRCGTAHAFARAREPGRRHAPTDSRPRHARGHTAPRGRAGAGIALVLAVAASVLITPLPDIGGHVDTRDEPPPNTVELARPHQPAGSVVTGDADAAPPPPCLSTSDTPCAEPILSASDLRTATPVAFGAVVVDRSLTLHRLHLVENGMQIRWRTQARMGLQDGPRDPTSSRLERTGTMLLLGTPGHLQAFHSLDGAQRWSASLSEHGDGVTPWRGWLVDDTVLATTGSTIVALDAEVGRIRWALAGPIRDVLPLATGVAVIRDERLEVYGTDDERPVWSRPAAATARFPAGTHVPARGPVVTTGGDHAILDVRTGAVITELGSSAAVTRSSSGRLVAAVWGEDAPTSALVGFDLDGTERWWTEGPAVGCCQVVLRPTADGDVIALFAGGAGSETGWIVDPTTGEVREQVVRPGDVAWIPREVTGSTIVWMDGGAFVGADPSGTPRWRAESQARLLTTSPLLLATRDGLLRPPGTGSNTDLPSAASDPSPWWDGQRSDDPRRAPPHASPSS